MDLEGNGGGLVRLQKSGCHAILNLVVAIMVVILCDTIVFINTISIIMHDHHDHAILNLVIAIMVIMISSLPW